ncbi:exonuclease domain-containing protein [Streptomyces angustmyceticus]
MTWHTGPMVGFDLETTGVDTETARIVTAALVFRAADTEYTTLTWLADPGIDIPEGAAAVHGITTEQAKANGEPAGKVVEAVTAYLAAAAREGQPLVAMNGRYDFTVIDRECRRHGLATLEELVGQPVGPVIDPLVLDKQADKYRRGSRKLEALAAHYGVELTDAHTADADARAAIEVAVAIAEKYPQIQVAADQLHAWQIQWAAQQAASFQEYKRRTDSTAVVEGGWPVVPFDARRAALITLAERWEQMAKSAPDFGGELFVDEPTPVQLQQVERATTYGRAAADLREVLRTGRIPHGLMTDAELDAHGTAQ